MTPWGERLRAELVAVAGQRLDMGELGALVSAALAPWLPHHGVRLVAAAPVGEPMLGSFAFWHGYPPSFMQALWTQALWHHADEKLLARHGMAEARVRLRDARGVWGVLGLLRGWPFTTAELRWLAGLGEELPEVLRAYVRAGPLMTEAPAPAAGVLVLGEDHRVRAATGQALLWREQLRAGWPTTSPIAESFLADMSRLARRSASTVVAHAPSASHGRWVVFEGQRLGPGEVAVTVRAASGTQLLPVFCDWYGITAREREVLADLYDGATPKHIARWRGLSVHTVYDHVKALCRKTGADGRPELVKAIAG
ncbi:helix-turn-helix transcriptional regulator [Crossiella sp. SN42]|uniref:helix-turn-helix transcriptional regulator n=1 Tax=Crossiella sp. SN42 TaxID=2944808 RepID=UPI00207CDCBE|nr:helix-turn-helix transcriptional regulator [Crossiella sp. SN42]MCO1577799.1 helix-turn-helix transcriptional regulator [Crossiella sp. SN42]